MCFKPRRVIIIDALCDVVFRINSEPHYIVTQSNVIIVQLQIHSDGALTCKKGERRFHAAPCIDILLALAIASVRCHGYGIHRRKKLAEEEGGCDVNVAGSGLRTEI